jgi:hypothetical protein
MQSGLLLEKLQHHPACYQGSRIRPVQHGFAHGPAGALTSKKETIGITTASCGAGWQRLVEGKTAAADFCLRAR